MFGGKYLSYSTQLIILLSSFASTYIIIYFSRAYAILDQPRDSRFHKIPTPRIGGLVLFFIPLCFLLVSLRSISTDVFSKKDFLQILSLTVVYLGGAWDDIKPSNNALNKLIIQVIACLIATASFGFSFLASVAVFLIFLFMVNSMNLMDNMNGLCAGLSLIVLNYLLFVGNQVGHDFIYFQLYIALSLALTGFFIINYFFGKIFMGDQGSQFLGMILPLVFFNIFEGQIISTIRTGDYTFFFKLVVITFFLFLPFLYDTFSVIYLRVKQNKPIHIGDTQHLSHRIVKRGNHPMVAVSYIFIFQSFALLIVHLLMTNWSIL